MSIDSEIRSLRVLARNAKDVDEFYHYFELLDKAQRKRYDKTGKYLPASDGRIWVYNIKEDEWIVYG